MNTLLKAGILSTTLIFCGINNVSAISIIDQSQTLSSGGIAFWGDLQVAQTFTAGITGQLTQLDIALGLNRGPNFSGNETAYISLVEWSTNMPGSVLGNSSILLDSPSSMQYLDLTSENIFLNTGSMYAFIISNDLSYYNILENGDRNTGIRVQWNTDDYSNGSLWANESSGWGERIGSDVVFTTHVNPVPIPAAIWLFSTGLLGLFGFSKRKTNT